MPKTIIYLKVLSKLQRHHQWKKSYDQAIDSDKKLEKEIRKLTTAKGRDHTSVCLLDYKYIKNHYRLITAI